MADCISYKSYRFAHIIKTSKNDIIMTNTPTVYSGKMKVADLISADWNLLSIFERLDIKLGFGEATVAELCTRYGLSTDLFLMICSIYSFNNYHPKAELLKKEDIPHILSYLRASHKYYTNNCLPRFHNDMHIMMDEYEDMNKYILNKFYDDYENEIKKHFEYEENNVFPYIEKILDNPQSNNIPYNISIYEHDHTNVEEKLNDLKNIIIKYLPENYSSNIRFKVVKSIFRIETDIRKHTLVENKLLTPLVAKLEQRNGK